MPRLTAKSESERSSRAADVDGDHQVDEQLERADGEHQHRRVRQRDDDERDEEQRRERAAGAAVDRHRAGDHGDLGDAPREEEDVVRAAVDDLLEREEPHEHAPGEVAGRERDEREPLGALPRADRVAGEHERRADTSARSGRPRCAGGT